MMIQLLIFEYDSNADLGDSNADLSDDSNADLGDDSNVDLEDDSNTWYLNLI